MSTIEMVAVAFGLLNVGLIIRRSVWNYPFGLAMVALYAWIFWGVKLYSDMLLQLFFFVVQIFGWINWLAHRQGDGLIMPKLLRMPSRWLSVLLTALGAGLLGWIMQGWTDASMPYWDAVIAAMSVTAQILLSMRRLESWLFWIATDIVAIGVFWSKDLQLTAALYVVFLALAVVGLRVWWLCLNAKSAPSGLRTAA